MILGIRPRLPVLVILSCCLIYSLFWCLAPPAAPAQPIRPEDCGPDGPWYSQFRQDELFWQCIGKYLAPGSKVYVDLAANDASLRSNTLYLDRCQGWRGLCIEALPRYFAGLYLNRTCALVPLCVSDRVHSGIFVDAGVLGGLAQTNKNLNGSASWQQYAKKASRITVGCVPLSRVLEREKVDEITFLSLDVEGHELGVLKGYPWGQVPLRVTAMEPNDPAAEDFLIAKGYSRIRVRGSDDWYIDPHWANVDDIRARMRALAPGVE